MNEEAGESKDREGQTKQAEDGDEWRDGFGDDGKNGQGARDGQADGAERLQIDYAC